MKVEFAAVKEDGGAIVPKTSEASRGRLDHLYLGVEALAYRVGYPVPLIIEQAGQVLSQHRRFLFHRQARFFRCFDD